MASTLIQKNLHNLREFPEISSMIEARPPASIIANVNEVFGRPLDAAGQRRQFRGRKGTTLSLSTLIHMRMQEGCGAGDAVRG